MTRAFLLVSILLCSTSAIAQDQKPDDQRPGNPSQWEAVPKKKAAKKKKVVIRTPGARGVLGGSKDQTRVVAEFEVGPDPLEISDLEMSTRYDKTLAERGKTLSAEENFDGIKKTLSPDIRFTDPAFPGLKGQEALAMWDFISNGDISSLEFKIHDVVGDTVYGSWEAHYTLNGRKIHNKIRSKLTVKDGKIVAHRDVFDFDAWAKQALPPFVYMPLHLFGSKVQNGAVRLGTRLVLKSFMKKNGYSSD
jgi:limonene-1,2-epoxide hydrolase